MTNDTPLTEVAQHLPPEVARMLMEHSQDTQLMVMKSLRSSIATLEELGVKLDPIQYQGVVSVLAVSSMGLLAALRDARR